MQKTTGIIALAAASALVLAGCSAETEEAAAPVDNGTVTEDVTTPVPEETVVEEPGLFEIPAGAYYFNYNYIPDIESESGGYGLGGMVIISENGTCEYELSTFDFGDIPTEGETLLTQLEGVTRTDAYNEGFVYNYADINQDNFTVPTATTLVASEGLWNTTYQDQFIGIAMNAMGDYSGPCFALHFGDLLVPTPGIEDDEVYSFDPTKIRAYEEERLTEMAEVMFGLEEDADALTAAWIAQADRYSGLFSDQMSIYVMPGDPENMQDPNEISFNISEVSDERNSIALISFVPEADDPEFPPMVFMPQIETPYNLGSFGRDLIAELR